MLSVFLLSQKEFNQSINSRLNLEHDSGYSRIKKFTVWPSNYWTSEIIQPVINDFLKLPDNFRIL